MVRTGAVLVLLVASSAGARAQESPYNLVAPVRSLATIFTDLFGPRGLIVDSLATLPGEQPHTAHFSSDFQFNFAQFGTALVGQLVSVPLPSPAGGFTYQFDATLGVFQRTTESFGPILADRADTIGARRVALGFAYQHFTYDAVEGIDLDRVPAIFVHDNAALRGGREDVVVTTNAIRAVVSQSTLFLTFGASDALDVSFAIPVITNRITVVSDATIHRLGTTNPLTHFYRQPDGEIGVRRLFTADAEASGIGDVLVRVKGRLARWGNAGLAAGVGVQLPTGDEMNLLGSGTAGIQPFVVWSATYDRISPHINASYRWNGSSVLAGNPTTGERAPFPDQAAYALGADISVNPRLTVSFDLLGTYIVDAPRLRAERFHALDGVSVFPNIGFARGSFNAVSGAVGVKGSLAGRLLLDVNLLFAIDSHGLRDKVTPLIGLEYTF